MKKDVLIFTKRSLGSLAVMLLLGNMAARGQTTYDLVYNLFQAKCISCHSSTTKSGQLDLSGSKDNVYAAIVGKDPVNPTAKSKGDKLIMPGHTQRSFLLRKCSNGLDYTLNIETSEGKTMPTNDALSKKDIEIIRQWILFGAKKTGSEVDTALIGKYYRGKGRDLTVKLAPPAPGEGFQIHLGPVFLPAKAETEHHLKYDLNLLDEIEVTRLDLNMNKKASHHMLLHQFEPGKAGSIAEGWRPIGIGDINPPPLICAWQTPYNFQLPKRTAYSWAQDIVLDFDFHYFNNNSDSVLCTDVRLNVYTQPKKTAEAIMYCKLFHNTFFFLPAKQKSTLIKEALFNDLPAGTKEMYIYCLSSHTHKYGRDFDIYERTSSGGKGKQLYEGFYDFEYTFNQGYFDWEHPAIKKFQPFHPLNPATGLVYETLYDNTGDKMVGFGPTTNDEMQLMFIQFTLKDVSQPSGIGNSPREPKHGLTAYPNPYADKTRIVYQVKEKARVQVEVYNILGERVALLVDETQNTGDYSYYFSAKEAGQAPGVYIVKVNINGEVSSQRIMELR